MAGQPFVRPGNNFDWKAALLLAWLTGAFVVMARLVAGVARVWLLTRRAQRVTENSWVTLARTLATRLRLRRRVEIFRTGQVSLPMTWGLMRPVVLMKATGVDKILTKEKR